MLNQFGKKERKKSESKDTLGLDGQLILHTPNWVRLRKCKTKNVTIFHRKSPKLGRFPFVRTDRPDRSRRNENFTFNKKLSSQIIECTKEIIFQQKLLEKAYFIFKLTGRAKVRPASSDKWKAPLVFSRVNRLNKNIGRQYNRK